VILIRRGEKLWEGEEVGWKKGGGEEKKTRVDSPVGSGSRSSHLYFRGGRVGRKLAQKTLGQNLVLSGRDTLRGWPGTMCINGGERAERKDRGTSGDKKTETRRKKFNIASQQ